MPADSTPTPDRGPYIGRSLPRFEDLRFVRGLGHYTADRALEGQAIAVFVRSPHAHARIVRIDTAPARARPGVVAGFTSDDYVADGGIGIPQAPVPNEAHD